MHDLVGRKYYQRLQGLNFCDASLNHRRQLAGENDQVGQIKFAALHFAIVWRYFFLDGDHQKVAVKQRRIGGLFSYSFYRAVDFPAVAVLPGLNKHMMAYLRFRNKTALN